ncbi:phage tail protein [Actinoplanes sp. NPDC023936]|uniref:phage tail protein n=1 Tax=Actinoplanes sp. NPDC023936 TaxID=3154910 RepID=UPI0033CA266C
MTTAATIARGSWWFGRGWLPWRAATSTVAVGGNGLSLTPRPGGPLGLGSPNGTLGGLVLPPTLAADRVTLWLFDRTACRLRLFDPISGRFGTVVSSHHLGGATSIAAAGKGIAAADPHRHDVIVLDPATLSVRAVLTLGDRHPIALAFAGDRLLVLDDEGTVHRATPALDRLEPLLRPPPPAGSGWRRIAVDTEGRIHLAGGEPPRIVARLSPGRWEHLPEARFPEPPITADHLGRFRVPSRFRIAGAPADQWFDPCGEPVTITPGDAAGPRTHGTLGDWTSAPLDSAILGCRWHRTVLTGVIPPGCSVSLRTFASDTAFDPAGVDDASWSRAHVLTGVPQPGKPADSAVDRDFAVLAERGRFLSVRLGLTGDGWDTPVVGQLLVEPQVAGLERFLPAIYRSEEQTTSFLHRFLAIFGAELDAVEQRLRSLPARFSPAAVPAGLVNALAAELGVALELTWTPEQRRALLAVAPGLYPRRGTPKAIREILRAHLRAELGHPVPESVPALVEGFRERPGATLGHTRVPTGAGVGLWSASVVNRPRLGARGRHDTINLISVGDQLTDRFRVHANRFTVLVPTGLLPDRDARDRFERLVAAEKPAQVAHQVLEIEPRTVLGGQALLGVDAYLGKRPAARLADAGDRTGPPLGRGLRLGGRGPGRDRPPPVGRDSYVGVRTVLV